jgi:hypothetical protein
MKSILNLMNLLEHCPECGALLQTLSSGAACAHCGYEGEKDPEERFCLSVGSFPGIRGEGAGFHLSDDMPDDWVGQAA